jgi:hypothetical protein
MFTFSSFSMYIMLSLPLQCWQSAAPLPFESPPAIGALQFMHYKQKVDVSPTPFVHVVATAVVATAVWCSVLTFNFFTANDMMLPARATGVGTWSDRVWSPLSRVFGSSMMGSKIRTNGFDSWCSRYCGSQ